MRGLDFDLHHPTSLWFLRCYLEFGKFGAKISRLASFILDLSLFDVEMLKYPASLRAQTALLLAHYVEEYAENATKLIPRRSSQSYSAAMARRGYSSKASVHMKKAGAGQLSSNNAGHNVVEGQASSFSRMRGCLACTHLLTLENIQEWEKIRPRVCAGNCRIVSTMCFEQTIKVLTDGRRKLKAMGLYGAEARNRRAASQISYPAIYPLELVECILPDS